MLSETYEDMDLMGQLSLGKSCFRSSKQRYV